METVISNEAVVVSVAVSAYCSNLTLVCLTGFLQPLNRVLQGQSYLSVVVRVLG